MGSENSEMKNESLIVFDTDLLIEQYKENYKNIFIVHLENDQRKIKLSENVINFKKNLVHDTCNQYKNSKVVNHNDIVNISNTTKDFDIIYPFIGENLDYLKKIEKSLQLNLNVVVKNEDLYCWQFSNKGYFNFKNNIPKILGKFIL